MSSKTTFHILYPNTYSMLSYGNWYINNKMKCLGRLKKELPLLLPFMRGWHLWNVFPLQGMWQCSVARRWKGAKPARWGTMCRLSPSGLISRAEVWAAPAETTGFLTYFPLEYFSSNDFIRSREKPLELVSFCDAEQLSLNFDQDSRERLCNLLYPSVILVYLEHSNFGSHLGVW